MIYWRCLKFDKKHMAWVDLNVDKLHPTLNSKMWARIWLICWQNAQCASHMLRKIFWRIYDGNFPFRCALILVQNPLLKHVQPLYFGFMVGLLIIKGLIFPQNPFHKTHKDLSPTYCYRWKIALPQENILFKFFNFVRFSDFRALHSSPLCTHPIWIYASLGV